MDYYKSLVRIQFEDPDDVDTQSDFDVVSCDWNFRSYSEHNSERILYLVRPPLGEIVGCGCGINDCFRISFSVLTVLALDEPAELHHEAVRCVNCERPGCTFEGKTCLT